jgi:L-asparagine transporter-like permease
VAVVVHGATVTLRRLGEMTVANPAVGSATEHWRNALGPWAGFTVG